eukprot:jgi/Chrpa1/4583/Chrysochromulina_OHIO_Genome00009592-RA
MLPSQIRALLAAAALGAASAYSPAPTASPCATLPRRAAVDRRAIFMEMEELEFIIHADGRVEERVRGIKGVDCQSVTAEINKALGEVIQSKPTQEMFEQKVELSVGVENTVSETWGNGGSSGSSKEW